jgi:hypothetical protein
MPRADLAVRLARQLELDRTRSEKLRLQQQKLKLQRQLATRRARYKRSNDKRALDKIERSRMPWPETELSIANVVGLRFSPPSCLDPSLWYRIVRC